MDRKYCSCQEKNGQICICIDFPDLNRACITGDFPLPITKLIIERKKGHEVHGWGV